MIDQQVKAFVLQALLAANGAMNDAALKGAIRAAFPGVSFTDGTLTQWISELENSRMVAGVEDEVTGVMWDLTAKGKIRAQQIS